MAELRARQPAAQPANPVKSPEDPAFDWTNFLQKLTSRSLAKNWCNGWLPLCSPGSPPWPGEARFVLQVISLWPDLRDDERTWAFQRLNDIVLWRFWVGLRLRQRAPHQLQPPTLSSHRAWCSHNNNLRDSAETAGNNQRQQPHKQQLQLHLLNSNSAEEVTEETINPEEPEEEDANNV